MTRLKLDQELLGISSVIEKLTGVYVKDCFREDDTIYIVVNPGQLGKAVGKGGVVIKRVQFQLRKNVRVMEFHDSAVEFVRNVIYPLAVEEIVEQEGQIIIRDSSRKVKSQLIGRDGKNLAVVKRAVQRFFPGKEVKVE